MREILARALAGPVSLMEDEWRERPVDRLHALASIQREDMHKKARDAAAAANLASLGVSLIWFRDSLNAKAFPDCVSKLAELIASHKALRVKSQTAELIAAHAILESKFNKCEDCKGRTDTKDGPCSVPNLSMMAGREKEDGAVPMMVCPTCRGTGVKRYPDSERGAVARFEDAFSYAHSMMSLAVDEADRGASWLLK